MKQIWWPLAFVTSAALLMSVVLPQGCLRPDSGPIPDSLFPSPSDLWPLPQNNAYEDLLATIELLPDQGTYSEPGPSEIPGNGIDSYTDSQIQAFLRAYEPALDRLRAGVNKPFVIPYHSLLNPTTHEQYFQKLSPVTGGSRQLVGYLCASSAYYQQRGRHENALGLLKEAAELSEDLSRGGPIILRLISQALLECTRHQWLNWSNSEPPGETLAEGVRFLLEFEKRRVPQWKNTAMEGWQLRQLLVSLRSERPSSHKWQKYGIVNPGSLLKIPLREVLESWDRHVLAVIELSKMPVYEAIDDQPPVVSLPALAPLQLDWLIGGFPRDAAHSACWEGLQIVLALQLYRQRKGDLPSKLGELVPLYLPQLPEDPFTGTDFCYARLDNFNYKLYSVGPNKVDDGGTQKGETWRLNDLDVVVCEMK